MKSTAGLRFGLTIEGSKGRTREREFVILRRDFEDGLVTVVGSTGQSWESVHARIPEIRQFMEQGKFKIPNTPHVRSAFAKVQKLITTSGAKAKPKYVATRDSTGHADEFFASLLAYHVARPPGPKVPDYDYDPQVNTLSAPVTRQELRLEDDDIPIAGYSAPLGGGGW